jgi:hypothetical protein
MWYSGLGHGLCDKGEAILIIFFGG